MSGEESDMGVANAASHEELCDQALKHYEEISTEAMHSSSLVPRAIEFYKERYVPQGERKIICTADNELSILEEALEEGWTFDPWLNPGGRPISIGSDGNEESYWVLVKGTPEQIAEMDPIAVLPEAEDEPQVGVEPYGLNTLYIAHDAVDESGDPVKPPEGYVIMHKDHIYAKGTVFTLRGTSDG